MLPGELFVIADREVHAINRRKAAHAYSMTALLEMEKYVDNCSTMFVDILEGYAERHQLIDLGDYLQYYAFDVIGEIT